MAASWSDAASVDQRMSLYGEVEPRQVVTLRSRADGLIESVASQGTVVRVGNELAQFRPTTARRGWHARRRNCRRPVSSGVVDGTTVAEALAALQGSLDATQFDEGVSVRFAGEIEDQAETMQFLVSAFVLAIFLMFLIMLTQLNSLFQSLLVLSAIACSLPGVCATTIRRSR